ncbi:uncharacterized protein METZ01_LOCUS222386, partial [marine metagenome]
EIVTVDASEFTDMASNNMAADATKTATTDTTAPTATATVVASSYTRAASGTIGTTGTFSITAVAGGIAEGTIGNLWSVQAIEGTAGALPTVSLFDTTNRNMVIAADFTTPVSASTPTAHRICEAVNDNADVSGNFLCQVVAGGTSAAVIAATTLTGGAVTHVVNVTYSEAMSPIAANFTAIAQYTVDADADTVYSDDGTESARTVGCSPAVASQTPAATGCGAATGANSWIGGTFQFLYTATTYAMDITKGSSKLGIGTSIQDFKGNAIGSSVVRVTIN